MTGGISDVLDTRKAVAKFFASTRTDHYGGTVSCFMDEFIGYDLSHEQVRDANLKLKRR